MSAVGPTFHYSRGTVEKLEEDRLPRYGDLSMYYNHTEERFHAVYDDTT